MSLLALTLRLFLGWTLILNIDIVSVRANDLGTDIAVRGAIDMDDCVVFGMGAVNKNIAVAVWYWYQYWYWFGIDIATVIDIVINTDERYRYANCECCLILLLLELCVNIWISIPMSILRF